MKKIIFLVFVFTSSFSFANEALKPSDFSNIYSEINRIESAKRVFTDEVVGVDLYTVTFVFNYLCDSSSNAEACKENLQAECLYVFHDTHLNEFEVTEFTCDRDIEDVLPPHLYDEY